MPVFNTINNPLNLSAENLKLLEELTPEQERMAAAMADLYDAMQGQDKIVDVYGQKDDNRTNNYKASLISLKSDSLAGSLCGGAYKERRLQLACLLTARMKRWGEPGASLFDDFYMKTHDYLLGDCFYFANFFRNNSFLRWEIENVIINDEQRKEKLKEIESAAKVVEHANPAAPYGSNIATSAVKVMSSRSIEDTLRMLAANLYASLTGRSSEVARMKYQGMESGYSLDSLTNTARMLADNGRALNAMLDARRVILLSVHDRNYIIHHFASDDQLPPAWRLLLLTKFVVSAMEAAALVNSIEQAGDRARYGVFFKSDLPSITVMAVGTKHSTTTKNAEGFVRSLCLNRPGYYTLKAMAPDGRSLTAQATVSAGSFLDDSNVLNFSFANVAMPFKEDRPAAPPPAPPQPKSETKRPAKPHNLQQVINQKEKEAHQLEGIAIVGVAIVMAVTMAMLWPWESHNTWWTVCGAAVVAAITSCLTYRPAINSFSRHVPQKVTEKDGEYFVKGLTRFNPFHVGISALLWAAVPIFLSLLISRLLELPDTCAAYAALRLTGRVMLPAAIGIAVLAVANAALRYYEILNGPLCTPDSMAERILRPMLPFTRSDIASAPAFLGDFAWKMFHFFLVALLTASLWFLLTLPIDNAQWHRRYHYWPCRPSTELSADSLQSLQKKLRDMLPHQQNSSEPKPVVTKPKKEKATRATNVDNKPTPQHVDVSNMYFKEGGRVYVQMGQQLQLQLVVEPSDYDETLEYSFSKAPGGIDIISVSPELVVTPVSRGESYVLITSSRTHKQVGCFVEVK
ncbi:MAG: hypothetical protein IKG77_10550 [Prevotella sp.]|nr:hypothetical protein [Prevotella sp.]